MSMELLTEPSQILQSVADKNAQCRTYSDNGVVDFDDVKGGEPTTAWPQSNHALLFGPDCASPPGAVSGREGMACGTRG